MEEPHALDEPRAAIDYMRTIGASFVGNLTDHQNIQRALATLDKILKKQIPAKEVKK